jgi:ribosomal protein L11 methyltransferase
VIRLAVRVRRDEAELALAELLDLVPAGVEETDLGDSIEYAVYGAPGELPDLPGLRAAAGGALVDVTTSEVPDDWAQRWKRFHRPLLVGGRVYVRPPWEARRPGVIDVVIDPGQAFGTGAHATTRLVLELLLEIGIDDTGGPLVDLGTGSGVLAVAAAKLGYAPVTAVDHDPASVAAARENAAANDVVLEIARVDLRREAIPAAPTVLANLVSPLLIELAPRLPDPLPRRLIVSGVLAHEGDAVAAAFAARGLRERSRRDLGEWTAVVLEPAA